jgi:uncharacterized membrane protein YfcA
MVNVLVLLVAAFLAGALNAVAGGGTFLTFPALVYAGLGPIPANATSAVAVFPGYLSGALGFRRELMAADRKRLLVQLLLSLVGGLAGSLLLLVTPASVFRAVVPWLLLAATLIFALGDKLAGAARAQTGRPAVPLLPGLFVVSVYGGYFNGGLGIMLMALFAAAGMRDLNAMNGLKNGISFVLSAISVATFAFAGIVAWPAALLMMVASTAGGYAGARVARAMSRRAVRTVIVLVGFGMSALFFLRG